MNEKRWKSHRKLVPTTKGTSLTDEAFALPLLENGYDLCRDRQRALAARAILSRGTPVESCKRKYELRVVDE